MDIEMQGLSTYARFQRVLEDLESKSLCFRSRYVAYRVSNRLEEENGFRYHVVNIQGVYYVMTDEEWNIWRAIR